MVSKCSKSTIKVRRKYAVRCIYDKSTVNMVKYSQYGKSTVNMVKYSQYDRSIALYGGA